MRKQDRILREQNQHSTQAPGEQAQPRPSDPKASASSDPKAGAPSAQPAKPPRQPGKLPLPD